MLLTCSIKVEERQRRLPTAGAGKQYQVIAGHPLPPWQKFMAVSSNKAALTNFLCSYIAEHAPNATHLTHVTAHPDRKIYLARGFTDGEYTACVSAHGVSPMEELFCFQGEADTT